MCSAFAPLDPEWLSAGVANNRSRADGSSGLSHDRRNPESGFNINPHRFVVLATHSHKSIEGTKTRGSYRLARTSDP